MADTLLPMDGRMKPILIIPPDEVSAEDIKLLNDNGICTVVAKNPSAIKFLDPIPSAMDRTKMEQAALSLSRRVLSSQAWNTYQDGRLARADITKFFIEALVQGTPLDPNPSQAEREQVVINEERRLELQRITREEVRAEQAAKRAAKAAGKK